MMLLTSAGEYPVPTAVAQRLPQVPRTPQPDQPDYESRRRAFADWLDASPENSIDYERLRRWHLIQDERASRAMASGQVFVVTADGLE